MTHLLPDEVIANVLNTLNKTNVSPLICFRTKLNGSAERDLLQTCEDLLRTGPANHNFLAALLDSFLSKHDAINLTDALRVFNAATDVTNDEDNMMLWIQGLSVLHSIISNEETAILPHELLTIVKDSYYCRDNDDEGYIPTFGSMFVLRALLSAQAIQSAKSRTLHSLQHSGTIRWRRLKSMVEDTISLFQRMLFEGFEIANDACENDTQSQSHPGTDFITIASWIYTLQIYPACQSLLSLLLEENHGDGIVNLKEGLVAKLFGTLTTLLALECTATPRGDLISTNRQVVTSIIASDEFFRNIRSYGQPQLDSGPSLEEDLLLHDRPHCNKFGQAILAFINLQSQLYPYNDATTLFPYPLSAEHRWTLLFPHVITFLVDEDASHIKLGFDMLQILVKGTLFIRPTQRGTAYTNITFQRAHSPDLLAQTLHTLLSLVLRISALEAAMPNSSSLEYSSLQVMSLAQSLKALYNANSQVQAIAEISQKIRDSDQGLIALLPKVLDWLRPVIMDICNKCKDSCEHSDLVLLCEVIKVLNPILVGVEEIFDDSTGMPKNIPSFFSMIESYTALFSSLRAMKMFIRINAPIDSSTDSTQLSFISEWLTHSLDRLILFKERLEKLIDLWSTETEASSPPPGHHRCLLLHYHLEEAVLELSDED